MASPRRMPPGDGLGGVGDVPVRLDRLEDQRPEGEPLVPPDTINPPVSGASGTDPAHHLIEDEQLNRPAPVRTTCRWCIKPAMDPLATCLSEIGSGPFQRSGSGCRRASSGKMNSAEGVGAGLVPTLFGLGADVRGCTAFPPRQFFSDLENQGLGSLEKVQDFVFDRNPCSLECRFQFLWSYVV